jgi:orotate phosphoribosyltransferase
VTDEPPRLRLLRLLRRLSYLEGDFTLTSGRQSHYLIDVKRTALHGEGARLIGEVMLSCLRDRWPMARAVGGRTLGADPLALSIAIASTRDGGPPLDAFVVRRRSKQHGTRRLLECAGTLTAPARVVVLDDVATTGGSALEAAREVAQAGFRVAGVLVLVDRREGAAGAVAAAGFEMASVFDIAEVQSIAP